MTLERKDPGMERRTLLAVVLIMAILIGDQILFGSRNRPRAPVRTPAGADSMAPAAGVRPDTAPARTGPSGVEPTPVAGSGAPAGSAAASPPESAASSRPALAARTDEPLLTRSLKTDHFTVRFTSEGAAIESWELPDVKDLVRKDPVDLVPEGARAVQVVVGTPYGVSDFSHVRFALDSYEAIAGAATFTATDSTGVRVTKRYRLSDTPHVIDLDVTLSVPAALGPIHYRVGWAAPLPVTERNADPRDLRAVAMVGDKLVDMDSTKLAKQGPKDESGSIRWAGNRSKYFLAAMIPDSAAISDVSYQADFGQRPVTWLAGGAPPGTEVVRHFQIFAGPIDYESLTSLGHGLDSVVNLGWKWLVPVSALILRLLTWCYGVLPNYGVAIILVSFFTKVVFHPLTHTSLRTMKIMHRLQPQVTELREKYKNDAQKMNQALMKLYKDNKVNPMSGCLPMILQIPIFFALYNVLLWSIEFRGAGFVAHVQDLSSPDVLMTVGGFPIHLLPILMTASSFLLQSLTPVDPRQRMMMFLMPAFFLVFMYNLPSGVILYWTVTNLVSALQQFVVNVAEDRRQATAA